MGDRLLASLICLAAVAIIATGIAVVEEIRNRPEPRVDIDDVQAFTMAYQVENQEESAAMVDTCSPLGIPSPPPLWGETEAITPSASATVDRAVYECLYPHTRMGLSPERMRHHRIAESTGALSKATPAVACREAAAGAPLTDQVSIDAANRLRQRVQECFNGIRPYAWEDLTSEQQRETASDLADLMTAYGYSYYRLTQEQALACRIEYQETIGMPASSKELVIAAEAGRRSFCGCALEALGHEPVDGADHC